LTDDDFLQFFANMARRAYRYQCLEEDASPEGLRELLGDDLTDTQVRLLWEAGRVLDLPITPYVEPPAVSGEIPWR
jgi:hypothetical protein